VVGSVVVRIGEYDAPGTDFLLPPGFGDRRQITATEDNWSGWFQGQSVNLVELSLSKTIVAPSDSRAGLAARSRAVARSANNWCFVLLSISSANLYFFDSLCPSLLPDSHLHSSSLVCQ